MKIHTEKTFEDAIDAYLLAQGWLQRLENKPQTCRGSQVVAPGELSHASRKFPKAFGKLSHP